MCSVLKLCGVKCMVWHWHQIYLVPKKKKIAISILLHNSLRFSHLTNLVKLLGRIEILKSIIVPNHIWHHFPSELQQKTNLQNSQKVIWHHFPSELQQKTNLQNSQKVEDMRGNRHGFTVKIVDRQRTQPQLHIQKKRMYFSQNCRCIQVCVFKNKVH